MLNYQRVRTINIIQNPETSHVFRIFLQKLPQLLSPPKPLFVKAAEDLDAVHLEKRHLAQRDVQQALRLHVIEFGTCQAVMVI